MNDRDYVIRACQIKGLDLMKPKRGNPGILAYNQDKPVSRCVIDAQKWAEAREQINAYYQKEANK